MDFWYFELYNTELYLFDVNYWALDSVIGLKIRH